MTIPKIEMPDVERMERISKELGLRTLENEGYVPVPTGKCRQCSKLTNKAFPIYDAYIRLCSVQCVDDYQDQIGKELLGE